MIERRKAFALLTLPFLLGPRRALAQTVTAPSIDTLIKVLDSPALVEKAVLGTSALRTLLWFEISRTDPGDTFGALTKDAPQFFEMLNQMRNANSRKVASAALATEEVKKRVADATSKALPSVKKMEETLSKGGLPPASALSKDLLTSFLQVNQFAAALSPNNDGWYCKVYPFRVVCG